MRKDDGGEEIEKARFARIGNVWYEISEGVRPGNISISCTTPERKALVLNALGQPHTRLSRAEVQTIDKLTDQQLLVLEDAIQAQLADMREGLGGLTWNVPCEGGSEIGAFYNATHPGLTHFVPYSAVAERFTPDQLATARVQLGWSVGPVERTNIASVVSLNVTDPSKLYGAPGGITEVAAKLHITNPTDFNPTKTAKDIRGAWTGSTAHRSAIVQESLKHAGIWACQGDDGALAVVSILSDGLNTAMDWPVSTRQANPPATGPYRVYFPIIMQAHG